MNQDKYIFSQILDLLPRYESDKCVEKYSGNKRIKKVNATLVMIKLHVKNNNNNNNSPADGV